MKLRVQAIEEGTINVTPSQNSEYILTCYGKAALGARLGEYKKALRTHEPFFQKHNKPAGPPATLLCTLFLSRPVYYIPVFMLT